MTRAAFLGSFSLIFLSCAALPACGQQEATQTFLARCSEPAPGHLDSCLEQARVLDETDPTPEAKALVAKLVQREAQLSEERRHQAAQMQDAAPPPDDNGVSSYDAAPAEPPPSPDLEPYQPPSPAQEDASPDAAGDDAAPPDSQAMPDAPEPGTMPSPPPDDGPGEATKQDR